MLTIPPSPADISADGPDRRLPIVADEAAEELLQSLDQLVCLLGEVTEQSLRDTAIDAGISIQEGGSPAIHVATVLKAQICGLNRVEVIETKAGQGCRKKSWKQWCRENPCPVAVRRIRPELRIKLRIQKAAEELLFHEGEPYGDGLIWNFFWRSAAVLRFIRYLGVLNGLADFGQYCHDKMLVCSSLNESGYRGGGVPAVASKTLELVTPADCYCSAALETLFYLHVKTLEELPKWW